MANDIGINLRVDAQTDGLKQAANDFSAFQSKLSSVLGITDPEKAEAYWDEYNSGLEKATKLADQMSMIEARSNRMQNRSAPGGGGGEGGGGDNRVVPFPGRGIFAAERTLRGAISGASRDASGAAVAVSEGILSKIGTMWASLPLPAKLATGIAAAGIGTAAVANTLSKEYEEVIPGVMGATAALKRFGTTADEQSALFRSTMSELSGSAVKYNYTLQNAMEITTAIAKASGGNHYDPGNVKNSAESVMRISRSLGYTSPISSLTELAGFASGYGQFGAEKYALGAAAGTTGSQTIEEVAGAMQAIMGNVFENGGVMSGAQAANTQKWLYDVFGKRAGGQGGAAAFANLSGAVRGASGLGKETDILLFQAAKALSGGDDMDAMMLMEQGFSPEIFGKFKESISGASEWDQIYLTSQAFGVNKTIAKQMLDGKYKGGVGAMDELAAGAAINGTSEAGITGAQEAISARIRELGSNVIDTKVAVLKKGDEIVEAILGPAGKAAKQRVIDEQFETLWGPTKKSIEDDRNGKISDLWTGKGASPNALEGSRIILQTIFENPIYREYLSKTSEGERNKLLAINGPEEGARWSTAEANRLLREISSKIGALGNQPIIVEIPPQQGGKPTR